MKSPLAPILLIFSLAAATLPLVGQDAPISVERVDFNSLPDDWAQVEIELRANANPSEEARDSRFVEDIQVKVYLAYLLNPAERKYDYYTADVEIVIMEQNDKKTVYFYLPGLIVERDRLPKDPEFYYVEVLVGGEALTPQKNAMSGNIPNLEILQKFISNAESEGIENEYLLMPIYLAPANRIGRINQDDLPTFLRREVRD